MDVKLEEHRLKKIFEHRREKVIWGCEETA
jgi:hypothetical protein